MAPPVLVIELRLGQHRNILTSFKLHTVVLPIMLEYYLILNIHSSLNEPSTTGILPNFENEIKPKLCFCLQMSLGLYGCSSILLK